MPKKKKIKQVKIDAKVTPTKPKIKDVCVKRKGKWINTLTKKEISESYAKRLNSYFRKNPEGNLSRAWGGSAYKEKKHISEQGKQIYKLWYKTKQHIKTKNRKGQIVYYAPFTYEEIEKTTAKKLEGFDYKFMEGKGFVHLYRITKDGMRVYHIIKWNIDEYIKHEWEFDSFMDNTLTFNIPALRHELYQILKKHRMSKNKYDVHLFGHIGATLHSQIDYYPMGQTFGQTLYDSKGINFCLDGMVNMFKKYFNKILLNNYRDIRFVNVFFYVYIEERISPKAVALAKYRKGVMGMKNGGKY